MKKTLQDFLFVLTGEYLKSGHFNIARLICRKPANYCMTLGNAAVCLFPWSPPWYDEQSSAPWWDNISFLWFVNLHFSILSHQPLNIDISALQKADKFQRGNHRQPYTQNLLKSPRFPRCNTLFHFSLWSVTQKIIIIHRLWICH